jgi:uncharacterized protein (DUF169 family)
MSKLKNQVEKIVQTLKLQIIPIGAKFSDTPDGKGVDQKSRICEALRGIRQRKVKVNLSEENCTCRVGRYIAGWEPLSPEELPSIFLDSGAYESKEVAEASVIRLPRPTRRGSFLILGPLDKFGTNPDVVLFFVNPEQADRILGLVSYKGAQPIVHYPITTTCSTITYPLAEGKPDINFISVFERQRGEWSPNELVVALPFSEFQTVVENIPHSRFGLGGTSPNAVDEKNQRTHNRYARISPLQRKYLLKLRLQITSFVSRLNVISRAKFQHESEEKRE